MTPNYVSIICDNGELLWTRFGILVDPTTTTTAAATVATTTTTATTLTHTRWGRIVGLLALLNADGRSLISCEDSKLNSRATFAKNPMAAADGSYRIHHTILYLYLILEYSQGVVCPASSPLFSWSIWFVLTYFDRLDRHVGNSVGAIPFFFHVAAQSIYLLCAHQIFSWKYRIFSREILRDLGFFPVSKYNLFVERSSI